jgi:hypothetical protein
MDEQPPRRRRTEPLLDDLGTAIMSGKDAVAFLWQVPDDADTRRRLVELLERIRELSTGQGRTEMPKLCDDLLAVVRVQPTPQQADMLQDGFDRLYKLWAAAKSGLM